MGGDRGRRGPRASQGGGGRGVRRQGARGGRGAFKELPPPPLVAPVTKHAATVRDVVGIAGEVDHALTLATAPHRGPVFLDIPMDELFSEATGALPALAA